MTKHIHYDTIMAWAKGATIEMFNPDNDSWHFVAHPSWYLNLEYRIKPEKKPDIMHETSITLSPFAGPMLYAASPSEANIVLLFDGETGKLKQCTIKGA